MPHLRLRNGSWKRPLGSSDVCRAVQTSLELGAQATILVREHCLRHDDARCRQAHRGDILPHVPTLGAGQASASSGPPNAAPMRLPRSDRQCQPERRHKRWTGSEREVGGPRRGRVTARTCASRRYRGRVCSEDSQCHNYAGYFCAGDAGWWLSGGEGTGRRCHSLWPPCCNWTSSVARSPISSCLTLQGTALSTLTPRSPTLVFGSRARVPPLSLAFAQLSKTTFALQHR
jgi:hypothetical protein